MNSELGIANVWVKIELDRKEILKMMELKERIIKEIENKAMLRGILGTKVVKITLVLTDEEIKDFKTLDFGEHYNLELEGNKLYISHVEEIAIDNQNTNEIPANQIKLKDTLIWNNGKTCEVTDLKADEAGEILITYKYFDDGTKQYEKNSEKIDFTRLIKIRRV